jgi:spore coat protein U domain-containing protein, fimbrial subunit CupE1/2/3/6
VRTRALLVGCGLLAGAILLVTRPALGACTINTTGVSFGSYNVFATSPLDSTGSVTYKCTGNSSINVTLSNGGAASFNPRRMLNGSQALNYNLYLDASRTTIWGDGTTGTQRYSNTNVPNNQNVTVTIYGRVPASQDVNAGAYSNSITATINF